MKPKISIVIPVYPMPNKDFFLKRCLDSVKSQTFTDYEIVMPENPNGWSANHVEGILRARGDLIKFLHMDDFFAHKGALQDIVNNFHAETNWLITGCDNNPHPYWNDEVCFGKNTLGGPSVLTIRNENPLLFNESLTWLVEKEYYQRLYERYGPPFILDGINVKIGLHKGQATHLISDEVKAREHEYMRKKYEKNISNTK